MKVTRLEIFGFKSFMDRLVLNFDQNLVGVVGPNGCGKSNIVDALVWVLGETHARQLRGNLLDEIIFNGTEIRRPLGMAEVSITVRPESGWQPALAPSDLELDEEVQRIASIDAETGHQSEATKYVGSSSNGHAVNSMAHLEGIPGLLDAAEIQLTRRLYRSGESEYFINRVPCRLRDMVEVYRMIGLGARGLSIVQQGQIGEIVSEKPLARRELLEEAAGISGIRARVEAAHRKLDKTETNISRLSDIYREVEKQVSTLRKQARRAEKRHQLKSDIRRWEREIFEIRAHNIEEQRSLAQARQSAVQEKLNATKLRVDSLTAREEAVRGDLETVDVLFRDQWIEKDRIAEQIVQLRNVEASSQVRRAELQNQIQALITAQEHVSERLTNCHEESVKRSGLVLEEKKKLNLIQEAHRVCEDELRLVEIELTGILSALRAVHAHEQELQNREDAPDRVRQNDEMSFPKLRDVVTVEEKFQRAFEALCETKLHYQICSQSELLNDIATLRAAMKGLPVGRIIHDPQSSSLNSEDIENSELREFLSSHGCPPFASIISVKPFYSETVLRLFAHTYFVSSLGLGLELIAEIKKRNLTDFRSFPIFVTELGEVVTKWGWYIGCSFQELTHHATLEAVASEIERFTENQKTLHQKEQQLQEQIRAVSREEAMVRSAIEFEERRISEIATEHLTLQSRLTTLEADQLALEQELTNIAQLSADDLEPIELLSELENKVRNLEVDLRSLGQKRDSFRLELAEIREALDPARRDVTVDQERWNEIRLELEKCEMELSMLRDEFHRVLGPEEHLASSDEHQGLSTVEREERLLQAVTERDDLLRRLDREGEVDPQAIELYQTEERRLQEMGRQLDDLKEAYRILESTIRRLKGIARERFLDTFHAVNEKFIALVPRLFGGGSGELQLVNPEDPLTSGVDLLLRPPGKKIKNLELLSGGEKALSATAVLMAMFLHRPSPLCVLDEVDAPLDEANLERFIALVRDISQSTQFLVITHNKQSMAAMDKLIGITMQERGVSSALTVTLDEAESELEARVANM